MTAVLIHRNADPSIVNEASVWTAIVFAAAVAILIVVAQFDAWKLEREARSLAEDKLNAKADLQGSTWVQLLLYNPLSDQTRDASGLRFTSIVVNHGRQECEISRTVLILSGPDFEAPRRQEQPLPALNVRRVGHGEQYRIDGMQMIIRGVRYSTLRRSMIAIHFIDSLGNEYAETSTQIEPASAEAT